jgi:hypothetical protein
MDAAGLIQKHRSKGVLIDSNLFVLYLVGLVNRRRIPGFKRTQAYTQDDFDLLCRLVAWFGRLAATPHVLSQVSDLADLRGKELVQVRALFKSMVEQIEESYDASRALVGHPLFERLGLADAAIATACSRGILVLTADLELHLALERRGADSLNFNHVRWSLG